MRNKKLNSIIAAATLASTLPVAAYQSKIDNKNNTVLITKHNQSINDSIVNTSTQLKETSSSSNNQNINYSNDLQIEVSNVAMQKISTGTDNPDTSYKPENNVPSTGDIVTQGTSVNYEISVSLRSKTGKLYPVSSASLSADPIVSYMNIDNETPQEKSALQQLQQSIQTQLSTLKDLNSTSSFVITASFNIGDADWNVKMLPNIKLNLKTPDGKIITVPINVNPLKETMKYTDTVGLQPNLNPDNSNKYVHFMTLGSYNQVTPYSPGVYNPANQNVKTITFKIDNPDPKNITITPMNISGLTKNPGGTYTVSENLLNSGKNLFKLTTTTDLQLRVPITVTPIKEDIQSSSSNINSSVATTMQYQGGQAILKQRNFRDNFSMSQSSNTSYTSQQYGNSNNNQVTFGSTMTAGVPGNYNIYTGSLVTNGEIVVNNANAPQGVNLINNGQVYCHLNDNAVNILKSGTASQKAQIMQDIVSGNMNGIGVKYTASELQTLMNEGKTVPSLNFTYVEKGYNGSNFSDQSSYITVPTNGNSNPVISRTITFGSLTGSYSDSKQKQIADELKDGQLPSDGVVESNGKLKGFILTPPNSYTDSAVKSDGIDQITDQRYGDYSHGLSAGYNRGSVQISVTAGNLGSSSATTVSTVKYNWFTQPQQFSVNIQGYGDGPTLMLKNTVITVDMGHSFKLIPGQPVEFGGYAVPAKDIKIDGNKLIVTVTPQIAQSLSSAPDLQYNAQYTNPSTIDGPISLGASLSGSNNSNGMVYQYNNKEVPAAKDGMPYIHYYNTKIAISKTISNDCLHYETSGKDNTVTLGNVITNNNKITKTYYIAGEIPTTGSDNLPGNDGEPGTGDLGTELQSLNTDGAPTWVLPKSAMNEENKEILISPSGTDLKGKLSYIESANSGWVKYKPGMDLKNIIGYFTAPTVGPRGSYTMTYGVKLTNVGKGEEGIPQVVNSAFKYYDTTDNIASTSNIVNITPPGTNLSNGWISTVRGIGCTITANDLNKTVEVNGKKISLKDLIGNGPDIDDNYDNTPTKLMNEVTLSQDAEALKKLGYKLVNITVNGTVRDLNWFENQGIVNNTGLTEVTFNLKSLAQEKTAVVKYTTTVKEVYSNGRPVVASKTTSGVEGSKVDTSIPEIPNGYQITKITVNGKVVPQNEVPIIQSKDNQTIIYTIGKIPTGIVDEKVITVNGTVVVKEHEIANGEIGHDIKLKPYTAPKGYHIIKVLVDGKEIDAKDESTMIHNLPNTINRPQTQITYILKKDAEQTGKITIYVQDQSGQLVGRPKTYSGVVGSNTPNMVPSIPEGDTVTSITNGNTVITSLPKTFTDGDQVIVYHVNSSEGKLTYIININGHEVKLSSLTGKTGDTASYDLPHNSHLKLENITVNGKEVSNNPAYHGKFSHDGTVVVYNYKTVVPSENTPAKPEIPSKETTNKDSNKTPDVKPSTPSYEGNKTPEVKPSTSNHEVDKIPEVKPSVPSKETPINHNGDKTPSKEIPSKDKPSTPSDKNEGNKTPSTSSHEGNKTPEVKPSTSNHEVDKTPEVKPSVPSKETPINHNGDKTPSKEITSKDKPSAPSDKNEGNKTPSTSNHEVDKIPEVKPSVPSKEIPINHNGDKTPSKEIPSKDKPSTPSDKNEGNKTPSTSSHEGNKTPEVKPSTSNHEVDKTPEVKPSVPSKEIPINHNGDKTPSKEIPLKDKPSTPSDKNEGNKTPSTSSHEGNKTPEVKPSTSNHEVDKIPEVKPSVPSKEIPINHNGDKTPSKEIPSKDKPSTPSDKNEGNKTPSTSSHEGNKTPEVKPSTSNHEVDKTPEVKPSVPSKEIPINHNGDKTPSKEIPLKDKPSTPSDKNEGNKTPSTSSHEGNKTPEVKPSTSNHEVDKTPEVKPSVPSKEIPINHNGDKTPSKEIPSKDKPSTPSDKNEGNKTPSTSSHEGNKTPEVKPSTSNHEVDKTPEVKPSVPSKETPINHNGDKTPSKEIPSKDKPSAPSDKNEGNKTPSTSNHEVDKIPEVKPSVPSKETPINHNGDKTPSKEIPSKDKPSTPSDKNEGNKTPSTSSHEGNKTPEVKPSTSNHEVDKTPEVKPSVPSKETPINHNGDKTPSKEIPSKDKPLTPSDKNEGNKTPSTSSHEGNKTPEVKPSTSDNHHNVVINHNNGNTTVNHLNGNTTVNTLPHTGLSNNVVDNTAKEAGALAGLFALIGGIFAFRKRK